MVRGIIHQPHNELRCARRGISSHRRPETLLIQGWRVFLRSSAV